MLQRCRIKAKSWMAVVREAVVLGKPWFTMTKIQEVPVG